MHDGGEAYDGYDNSDRDAQIQPDADQRESNQGAAADNQNRNKSN